MLKRKHRAFLNNMSEYDEYAFDYAQVVLKEGVKAPSLTPLLKEEKLEEAALLMGQKLFLLVLVINFQKKMKRKRKRKILMVFQRPL